MGFQANHVQTPSGEIPEGAPALPKGVNLSKQETEFLLSLIRESTFKGEMIDIVYKTAYKLQEHHSKIK